MQKKKLLTLLIAVFVLISTVQVYAATALDSDIITLVSEGITEIQNYYTSQSEAETEALKSQYQDDINEFIDNEVEEFEGKLEEHKNNEVNRGNQELTNYIEDLKPAIKAEFDSALDVAKDSITNEIEGKIESSKKDIDNIFKSIIKDKVTPKNN